MKIRAVLDRKYYEEVPTVKIHAGVLNTLQHVSRTIKSLNELLPVPTLQHLKRVKRCNGKAYVILDLVTEPEETPAKKVKLDQEPILTRLKDMGFPSEEYGMLSVEVHDVPATPPLTRFQYEKAMNYWPVNFHPVKELETLMSDTIFDVSEEAYHVANMKNVADEADKTGRNVALVVDFENKQWIAKGVERTDVHPLQHAVMVAVDAVAGTHEGGGAWNLPLDKLAFVKNAVAKVPDVELYEDEEEIAPYLCTGYDIYVNREPCVMCSMSLIHSRIKRVFFRVVNESRGALMSKCQIHTIRDLNHHYTVFHMSD